MEVGKITVAPAAEIADVEVIAQPTRSVTLRGGTVEKGTRGDLALEIGPSAPGWTFDGFIFEVVSGLPSKDAVVRVKADRTTIRRSRISGSTQGACLKVHGDHVPGQGHLPVEHFTLESSEVAGCFDPENRGKDVHCIHSYSGRKMAIVDNLIHQCQGDGVQLENDYKDPPCYAGVQSQCVPGTWSDVTISGNTFESHPDDALAVSWGQSPGEGVRPGENAVDLKPGGGNVVISHNSMRGFRSFSPPAGVGLGSGTDGQGSAVTLSGPFLGCDGDCVEIIGNDIMDSNIGISVSQHPSWDATGSGFTDGILIARNVLHHLTANEIPPMGDPTEQGSGIRLARQLKNVRVINNTIASSPGNPFYVPSSGVCVGCSISDNFVSYSGNYPGGACTSGSGSIPVSGNLCTPGGDLRRECSIGEGNIGSFSDSNAQFVDDPPAYRPSACGINPDPLNPDLKPDSWDYTLTSGSQAIDQVLVSNGAPGPRCDPFGDFDSQAVADTGAMEFCGSNGLIIIPDANAELSITAPGPYRLSAEFVYAKGAYADASQIPGLLSSCFGKNNVTGEGSPMPACLFSTHRCLEFCGRHTNGEIDCTCMDNVERQIPMASPAHAAPIQAALQIDWNSDYDFDERRFGDNGTYQAVGFTRISDLQYLAEWEDRETDITEGDRNDFVTSIRALQCTDSGLQQVEAIRQGEILECPSSSSCQQCGVSGLQAAKVSVTAMMSADSNEREIPEGRLIFATVNVWRGADRSTADTRLAVCPVLELEDPALGQISVLTTPVSYNGSGGQVCGALPDAVPDCNPEAPGNPVISLSRSQRSQVSGAACSTYPSELGMTAGSDDFVLEPAKRCGNVIMPTARTVTFPIALQDLISAMPPGTSLNPGTPLDPDLPESLDEYISGLKVYVFADIMTSRFMCPSGVRVAPLAGDFVSSELAALSVVEFDVDEVERRQ